MSSLTSSRFVSAISTCKVLQESPTGLLREVQFKGKPAPMHEDVTYYPPAQVTAYIARSTVPR